MYEAKFLPPLKEIALSLDGTPAPVPRNVISNISLCTEVIGDRTLGELLPLLIMLLAQMDVPTVRILEFK